MSEVIIDTNVAVVANRQNLDVVEACSDACIQFLSDVPAHHIVLLDEGDEIRGEYARALQTGQPYQLGALFLFHLLQQRSNPSHVREVDLDKDQSGGFADFPDAPELANFDKSDRKFAALSRKAGVAVTNAVDSDWVDSLGALNAHGISVDFLCGCDKALWFRGQARNR